MFCRNCGNQLTDNSRFCGKCGASQNLETENSLNKLSLDENMKTSHKGILGFVKQNKKKALLLLTGVIVITVILVIIITGNKKYDYNGSTFSESQLEQICLELCVPEDLDVVIDEGIPYEFEARNCTLVPITIYSNNKKIASGDVDVDEATVKANIYFYQKNSDSVENPTTSKYQKTNSYNIPCNGNSELAIEAANVFADKYGGTGSDWNLISVDASVTGMKGTYRYKYSWAGNTYTKTIDFTITDYGEYRNYQWNGDYYNLFY